VLAGSGCLLIPWLARVAVADELVSRCVSWRAPRVCGILLFFMLPVILYISYVCFYVRTMFASMAWTMFCLSVLPLCFTMFASMINL
jgi:hypothetical protein